MDEIDSSANRLIRYVDIGVEVGDPTARVRWVRTINVVAGASLMVSTAYSVFYAALDLAVLWPVVATNMVWNIGYLLVIRLNQLRHPRRAAWLALFVGLANTLTPAVFLGVGSGVYLFLVLIPMIGVLLSGPDDHLMRVTVIVLGALAFTIVPMMFVRAPHVLDRTVAGTALFASSALGVALFGSFFAFYYKWLVERAEDALAAANDRSERLLLNILPSPVVERLKTEETRIADRVEDVTVLFADIAGSTPLAELLTAEDLVAFLDRLFSHFDDLTAEHGLEKIATIGDSYVAVAGLHGRLPTTADAADLALAMRDALNDFAIPGQGAIRMKFGLASGPVVAGVIGKHKIRYDIWGDTVNLASRMESHGRPGAIHVTSAIKDALADEYSFISRGGIFIKGKGTMETFFLTGKTAKAVPEIAVAGGIEPLVTS